MSDYKDTFNIEPGYLIKRIKKDFDITYNLISGQSWSVLVMNSDEIFIDEERAIHLLNKSRHLNFYLNKNSTDEDKKEVEINKLILVELVELIKNKNEFIKKIGAAYRKKIQREKAKYVNETKRVEISISTSYALDNIAKTLGLNQKQALDVIINDFNSVMFDIETIAQKNKTSNEEAYLSAKEEQKKLIRKLSY